MERLIRPSKVIRKYIDILVNIDDYPIDSPVAANAKTFQPFLQRYEF